MHVLKTTLRSAFSLFFLINVNFKEKPFPNFRLAEAMCPLFWNAMEFRTYIKISRTFICLPGLPWKPFYEKNNLPEN